MGGQLIGSDVAIAVRVGGLMFGPHPLPLVPLKLPVAIGVVLANHPFGKTPHAGRGFITAV
jgi:hypothetical protein